MQTKYWGYPQGKNVRFKGLRNLVACAMLASLVCLGAIGQASAEDAFSPRLALTQPDKAWLAAHPVIRLGIDASYGPYSFLDGQGKLQGVVREFLDYLEPTLGVRFEIISYLDWPQLMAAVQAHRIDAVATVVQLPERDAFLAFTSIYLPTPLVIMTRDDAPPIRSLQKLSGLDIVQVKGYSSSKQLLDRYPDLRVHYVDTPLDGLRAVSSGAADAYVGVLGVNAYLAAQNGIANLKANAGFDMKTNGQRFGVRKDWPQLARMLDQALASMPAQQKNAAFQKWLPLHAQSIQSLSQPTWVSRLFPWLLGLIGLSLLGYLVMLLWSRQLKRELAQRQGELVASTARLRAAETIAHLGNWQFNVADGSIQWSDEVYRIYGVEPQAQSITHEWLMARIHPDDRADHDACVQRMLESHPGQAIPEWRYRLVRAGGEVRTVSVRVQIEYDASGKAHTLFGTLQDISAQIRADEHIAALNRLYRVLSGINEAIVRLRDPQLLFNEACRIAVEIGGFRMAWLGMVEAEPHEIRPLAYAGVDDHYLENLHISLDEDEYARGPTGTALLAGHHAVCNDIANDPNMAPWRDAALSRGYRASAAFPIRLNGQTRGVFSLYTDRIGFFDEDELRLLDELAADIGFALEFIEVDRARETLNRRMVDMLESISDGFVSLDREGCYQYVNCKAGEMFGRAAAELLGKHIWTEFPEEVDHPFRTACEQVMHGGEMVRLESYHAPSDRWYENRIYPSLDGISVFFTDITERKRTETALVESESRLRLFIEHAPAALAMFDREMRYLAVSRRWLTDYQLERSDILGLSHYEIFTSVPERWKAMHRLALAGEVVRTEEDPVEREDGSVQWLHWEARPWFAADSEVGGIVIFSEDITERKDAEARALQNLMLLDSVFQALPDAFFLMEADGTIRDYRAQQENKMYAPPNVYLGKRMKDVLPAELGEIFQDKVAEVGKKGGLVSFEYALSLPESTGHFEARMTRLPGSTQLIAVIRDITRQYQDHLALGKSESRYRLLFERSPAPMLVYERGTLRMLAVNEAFLHHYGYSHDEALALRLTDLYPDEEKQRIAHFAAGLAGLAFVGEWHHLKKNGSQITIEARSHDLPYEGRAARVAVISDITERNQAERSLIDSEARYRSLLEMAPFPAVITRMRDGLLVYGNHRAELQYGISRQNGIGQPAERFYEDASQRELFLAPLNKEGKVDDLEVRMLTAEGHPFWALVSASIVEFENEPAIFTAINDITARKQVEAALREQEAFFRLIAENIGDMVAVLDLEGRRLYNSPSYRALFGEPDALQGTDSFADIHPDDRDKVRKVFTETVRTGHGYRVNFRFVLADGRVRSIESQGGVIRGEGGQVERVVVVSRDITERRQMEDEIRQLNTELEARVRQRTAELAMANQELETFTYSVSHDLKAPLRGIDGYSQLLLEDYRKSLDEAGCQLVNNVRSGVAQMSLLIEDLLAYSRMERRSLQEQTLDISKLVAGTLDALRADIEARNMVVEISLQGLAARADPEGLAIVLRNLVENALKFTRGSHPPSLSISGVAGKESITLIVKDNGIGFDMHFKDRIFEIFQRLQRAEDYPGTGVGLAIVYKAMQRMGGRVWAESTPGQGATFYLELPR
jgi:PAS domain S-box-containing protein